MKHAYLILTHNEFEVLESLAKCLDHIDNDIFIHYDKKVIKLPRIHLQQSKVEVLDRRIDGCWGDWSLVEIELSLLKTAMQKGHYDFFHIISGVHYPLLPNEELHGIYEAENKSFFQPMFASENEIDIRMRRYNLFNKLMMSYRFDSFGYRLGRLLWNLVLKLQKILNYTRNRNFEFYKSSQWCTLTRDAVCYLLKKENEIKKRYSFTFCPDEYFALSELMNSPLRNQIVLKDNLLKQDWVTTHPKIYLLEDYEELVSSGCLYARKFSSESIRLIECINESVHCISSNV